jgi:thioester reductase-like protein
MHAAEAPLPDPRMAVGSGYGESKWVCETILIRAAKTAQDLPYTIVRPGQISGSPNGAWDVGHWAPAIIVAGPIVQALPRVKGVGLRSFPVCPIR